MSSDFNERFARDEARIDILEKSFREFVLNNSIMMESVKKDLEHIKGKLENGIIGKLDDMKEQCLKCLPRIETNENMAKSNEKLLWVIIKALLTIAIGGIMGGVAVLFVQNIGKFI